MDGLGSLLNETRGERLQSDVDRGHRGRQKFQVYGGHGRSHGPAQTIDDVTQRAREILEHHGASALESFQLGFEVLRILVRSDHDGYELQVS